MKATRIKLLSLSSPQMRAFHLSWVAFFVCFFGWFGIAPLMPLVRDEFQLSKAQIGNIMIASVAITIVARLFVGVLCDKFGPRRVYAGLLALGSIPVMGIGLATNYTSFLIMRLLIGAIGASFVITQYHTSAMFAPNTVGTANATTAGWGNMGGGVTQMVMPLVVTGLLALGIAEPLSWRLAMVVPGVLMLVLAGLYLRFTQDTPSGKHVPAQGKGAPGKSFLSALSDVRVWALFVVYGACFGVELTIHNIAALYFHDRFALDLKSAGLIAGSFGVLALFARTLGGVLADRAGMRFGLRGRALFLCAVLFAEGMFLLLFSRMNALPLAAACLMGFGLFVHMSAGATYAVVPFVKRDAVGAVSGIVGAGGNSGAVLAGFLFRSEGVSTQTGLFWLGIAVSLSAFCALVVRFSESEERRVALELEAMRGEPAKELVPAE